MTMIRLNNFGGIIPATDAAKLPDSAALLADGCDFEGGDVVPMFEATEVPVNYPVLGANVRSLFRLTDTQWCAWLGDVAATRIPVPHQADYLSLPDDWGFIYTGDHGELPQWPRISSKYRAMGNADTAGFFGPPALSSPLGVPPPQSVPTVSVSAAASGTITGMKASNPVEVTCSSAHGLSTGNRVQITGMPSSGDGIELNGVAFRITVVSTTVFKLDSADGSEWEGDLTLSASWVRSYSDEELEDRVYCYTYVDADGREGAPTGPSTMVSVGPGQTVSVTMDTSASVTVGSSPAFLVAKKRIYRTLTGTAGAEFYFVAEVLVSQATYVDSVAEISLGEELPTDNYDLPPARLQGVIWHPGGFMVGFVDNTIYCCEPYQVHAWPADYKKPIAHKIIGLSIYGTTVVAITEGPPYLATATDPGSLTFRAAGKPYPGTQRQAIVSTGHSVVYVSPVGLVAIDQAGATVLTDRYYTQKQWSDGIGLSQNLDLCLAYQAERIWLNVEMMGIAMFRRRVGDQGMDISSHGYSASCVYADNYSDRHWFMQGGLFDASRLLHQYPGATSVDGTFSWKSKRFVLPREVNFGWIQAQGIAVMFPSSIAVRVHRFDSASGTSSRNYVLTNNQPARMESGWLAGEYEIEIVARTPVRSVLLAEHLEELRRVDL